MLIRCKSGEFRPVEKSGLLEFLGVREGASGVQSVTGDVQIVETVPLSIGEGEKGASAIPDGTGFTFSTFDLDRFYERVDPQGWKLDNYRKNPVVQWAHLFDIPAIGRADGLYADDKGLHGSVIFNDKEYDPFGWAIGERVKAGVIRAGSVGFRVLEIELPSKEESKDGTTLIFRKQELLEFSVCNVPANPFALAKSFAPAEPVSVDLAASRRQFWGGFIGIN
jgi:HK97 family phage prohead protease